MFEVVGGSKTSAPATKVLVSGWAESAVVVVVAARSVASALMLVVLVVGSRSLFKLGFGAVVVSGVLVV